MLANRSPIGVSRAAPSKSRFHSWSGFFIAFLLVLTSACSHDGAATLDSAKWVARAFVPSAAGYAPATRLDPRYRYLRVQLGQGAPALLVLGDVDPHPLGPIEVWYSANGEVLKLQNGRVVATHGLVTDWPAVRFERAPVAWKEVGTEGSSYVRLRDEIPSYRYGLRQTVTIRQSAQTPKLQSLSTWSPNRAARYQWYQETVPDVNGSASVSWFALGVREGVHTVVFSEQCIAPGLCLQIQPWPADEGDL